MNTRTLALPGLVFLVCVAHVTRAQTPADEWFTLRKIAPNVWAAIDNPKAKQRAYANAGFVVGDDGVVVIDTLTTEESARHLLQQIRKLTALPVKFVVNTHYHGDHVGGNKVFTDIGARVLAHRNVREWIHAENLRLLGDNPKPELKTLIEQFVAPTVSYAEAVDVYLGSRVVQVRSFPGHTGGDSVVILPDAKVVFGGDLVWRNMVPNTVDGSTKPWMQTLETLAGTYAGYTFVPGHGDVSTAKDVTAFRDYLATLQKLVADARAGGKSGDAATQAVMPALTEKYGHWGFFEYLVPRNIAEAEAELSGTKRIPQASPVK
jgi:glyoxylase-like metal-dependent hydrolase (beta-lactamase superfamily II)